MSRWIASLSALVGLLVLLAGAGNADASIPIASAAAAKSLSSVAAAGGESPQRPPAGAPLPVVKGVVAGAAGSVTGAVDVPIAHAPGAAPIPLGAGGVHGADPAPGLGKALPAVGKPAPHGAASIAQGGGKALAPVDKLVAHAAGPITQALGKAPAPLAKPAGAASAGQRVIPSLPVVKGLAAAVTEDPRSVVPRLLGASPIPRDLGPSNPGEALTPVIDRVSRTVGVPLAPVSVATRGLLDATRGLAVQQDEAISVGPGEKLDPTRPHAPMPLPATAASRGAPGTPASGTSQAPSAPAATPASLASVRWSGGGGPSSAPRPTSSLAPGSSALIPSSTEAPIDVSLVGGPARSGPLAGAPSPAGPTPGGASGSTAGAFGVGLSVVLGLVGFLLLGPAQGLRRLRLSSEPWLTATFALMPERPG